ncbi:MAG: MoaD/ThiS family protein [Candidatus Methanosuratincola sp.]
MGNAICVRFFASLREKAGKERATFEFNDRPTIQEVLERVLVEIPSLEGTFFKDGRLDEGYKVMSGKELVPLSEFRKKVADENLTILPPVSGG